MQGNYFKYLNVSEVDKDWGFYVTSVGFSKVEPDENYPNAEHPESHSLTWNKGRILNDYYLIFISKGKGLFASDKMPETQVLEGTCFFLYPGVKHRYKPCAHSGWEEYWVGFNGIFADRFMEKGLLTTGDSLIDVGLHKELLYLFRHMTEIAKASFSGYHQQLAGTAFQILGHVDTVSSGLDYKNDPLGKLIAKAKFIIHESFEQPLDMQELAAQLPMGYSAFRKAFKQSTGESPNQYHLNLRLKRAKELLRSTVLNINEIAYQTGFESVFHFSKLFKKKNGISPKVYRLSDEML